MLSIVEIETPPGDALVDITEQVRGAVSASGVTAGICLLIVPHTTAGITINSGLDPATPTDILADIRRPCAEAGGFRPSVRHARRCRRSY